jgi:hypothetical protein
VGFEGMYEYEPPGADLELIAVGLPAACLVSDPSTALGKEDDDGNLTWSAAQGSCEETFEAAAQDRQADPEHRRIHVAATRAGYLVLRLLSYPAWRVRVNGQTVANLPRREDGLIVMPVQQGAMDVTVDWTTTPDVTASRWMSAIGALLLVGLCAAERRRPSHQKQLRTGARLS